MTARMFQHKPTVVEAMLAAEDNLAEVFDWVGHDNAERDEDWDGAETLEVWNSAKEVWLSVDPGDWVIKGVDGDFYVAPGHVFEESYEALKGAEKPADGKSGA